MIWNFPTVIVVDVRLLLEPVEQGPHLVLIDQLVDGSEENCSFPHEVEPEIDLLLRRCRATGIVERNRFLVDDPPGDIRAGLLDNFPVKDVVLRHLILTDLVTVWNVEHVSQEV